MSYIQPIGQHLDAETVILRLEEAGRTLLSLPNRHCAPASAGFNWPAVIHAANEAYGYNQTEVRPPVPSAQAITRMDEAFTWVVLIPDDRITHRRLVWMRALVHPVRDRHIWPWRKIGKALNCHHQAVQLWHAQAIDMIVAAANKRPVKRGRALVSGPRR